MAERVARLAELHESEPLLAAAGGVDAGRGGRRTPPSRATGAARRPSAPSASRAWSRSPRSSSRPGRAGERLREEGVCERLQITGAELREDVNVLNVVNFGGGSYVLYAEVGDDGWIEVDPEPYSDNFARPARLLPVEAKALVAAIDLIGEHLPEGALTSAREKIVAALGADPMEQGLQIASAGGDDSVIARVVSEAIVARHLLRLEYYKANEDEFSERTVEPYALINGREGWYVACFDPAKDDVRHFRLDRIKTAEVLERSFKPRPEVDPAADVEGWPRTGEVEASRTARVWISPERARWAREERTVVQDLEDGALDRRAELRRRGLAGARGAQGGRRRRRARAARGARGRAARRGPPAGRSARLAVAAAGRMARDAPVAGAMFCRAAVGRHSVHRSAVAGAAAPANRRETIFICDP